MSDTCWFVPVIIGNRVTDGMLVHVPIMHSVSVISVLVSCRLVQELSCLVTRTTRGLAESQMLPLAVFSTS